MEEEPQDDGARLTQLADFWLYEHLLSLPKSIATDEIINHLGSKYPFRHGEGASLPAPISARLFLRHLREPPQLPITDWEEQLQLLGLMCQLSCKREQFRSRQAAAAMHPPSELMVEVLMQLLCTRANPAFAELDEQGEQQQPLTSAGVAAAAEELLANADVEYLQDDEQLQNRLSLLEQLLRGRLEARKLQKHLREAFPAAAVEEHLREYAEKAWAALGDTSLQRYQAEVLSGSLPFDPMQHFATLAPVATQAAFEDVAVLDDAAEASQQQRQQRTRGSKPVPLLGEATAPVLGAEDLELPGSSQGRRAGRGSRLQQAAAGASPQPKASPMARASPQQARSSPAAAAAAAAAGADDVGKPGRRGRAPSNKAGQEAAPAAHPTRKQLQLLPSNAAAAAAAGVDRPEAEGGGRKGRKSRKQLQEEAEIIESEPPAAAADLAAAAAAGSGGRRRGRKASPAPAAVEAGSDEEQQAADGLDLLAAAGAAQEGGAQKGLGSAFQSFLNKPLDSLAGLAAAVRGSPAAASGGVSGGPKERKMCGAPTQGVKGKTVPWESPFGGNIDSPDEDSPKGKAGKSPAAAAAGPPSRPAVEARKRKRAQQAAAAAGGQQKGPLAAARAAGAARAPDSGNTEYQDAEEEAGQSEESQELPAAAAAAGGKQRGQGKGSRQSPRHKLHKQHQQQRVSPQRRGAAAAAAAAGGGDDSSVDDPESDDAFNYDGVSDEEGGGGGQQQQRRRQGRPGSKQQQQHRKRQAGAASGGRARGAGAAAAAAAAAFDDDFDVAHVALEGYKRRRKIRYWSADEEALLIQLVAQHGEGQWALIHQLGGDGFDNRTQVDLKDKWRNLKKRGAVSEDWN